ncbi:rhodanese-like domain-containing protein [Granulicella sp. WH15]|uniref:rhodanese-like domain-containing protein n=1 Tax=Granulicella sp. WH15 TaxID=2602070 RepID=UPI001366D221|nr:rhodanese-like domain-containing protein [Granulicella sp. WH15]QHN03882.1 rhodanese-like domain-containing protein [Granulicella sp. WH15]
MTLALIILALILVAALLVWRKRVRDREELERYTVSPQELARMLKSNPDVLLLDVRLPLDLLADSTIIPGAQRIAPQEILANPELVPQDKDAIVYCTCPGDKTSRKIIGRALSLNFTRIKLLRGGLGAWKENGFPVEPYTQSFHLDTLR